MKIVKVRDTELKNSLVKREGFELLGQSGDNVTCPVIYSVMGDINRLSERQRSGIIFHKWQDKNKISKEERYGKSS